MLYPHGTYGIDRQLRPHFGAAGTLPREDLIQYFYCRLLQRSYLPKQKEALVFEAPQTQPEAASYTGTASAAKGRYWIAHGLENLSRHRIRPNRCLLAVEN